MYPSLHGSLATNMVSKHSMGTFQYPIPYSTALDFIQKHGTISWAKHTTDAPISQ